MEPIYIIAIAAGSIFLFLLIIYSLMSDYRKRKQEKFNIELDKAYAPKNLKTMDYDLAYYDDETARRILDEKIIEEKQVTIEDIIAPFGGNEDDDNDDDDELVGHYKP